MSSHDVWLDANTTGRPPNSGRWCPTTRTRSPSNRHTNAQYPRATTTFARPGVSRQTDCTTAAPAVNTRIATARPAARTRPIQPPAPVAAHSGTASETNRGLPPCSGTDSMLQNTATLLAKQRRRP